jgi:hypothetical protein
MQRVRRDKYDIYNKIKLRKPEIGKTQSLLFSTIIASTNPKNNKSEKHIFEREVDLIYLGPDEQYDVFQIFYLDADFKLTNKYKSSASYLKKISFVFDDILIGVDSNGTIKKIFNLNEIADRWKQIEQELNNTYEGDEFENYKRGIKRLVENEVDLIIFFKLPSMYGNYFNGLWDTFNYEAFYDNTVHYGKEIGYKEVNEKVICKKVVSDDSNQVLEMEIKSMDTDLEHYEGFYKYYNGFMNNCKKNIVFNNINTTYTIQWKGIQPIIQ